LSTKNYDFAGRVAGHRLGIPFATLKMGDVYP
jgi:hypothetical protein